MNKVASNLKVLHLAQQLTDRFSDRDIGLWREVVIYLKKDKAGSSKSTEICGTCAFHILFEQACRSILEMQEELIAKLFENLNSDVKWQFF